MTERACRKCILRDDEIGPEAKDGIAVGRSPVQVYGVAAVIDILHDDHIAICIVRGPGTVRPYPCRPGELLIRQARACSNIDLAAGSEFETCPDNRRDERNGIRRD